VNVRLLAVLLDFWLLCWSRPRRVDRADPAPSRGGPERNRGREVNVSLRRIVAAFALVPVISSCGFDQPTDRVYSPGVGVNERSGSVDVLNALVVSGADGTGSMVATLVNNDRAEGDALTQVTGAGQDSGVSVRLRRPVDMRAGGSVSLSDESQISVEGERVRPGAFLALTFVFERGASVTLDVPVVARRGPYADIPVPSVAPTTAAPEEEPAAH
jgi:hypothetical protein